MKTIRRALKLACVIALPLVALLIVLPLAEAQVQSVNWTHLSSATGDLPLPPASDGQSGLRVVDFDQNGQNDYVITLWWSTESIIWYRHIGDTFEKYVIDTNTRHLSHGEGFKDIDGDGDLDLLIGDATWGDKIYWWENPYPDYEKNTPWVRRVIWDTGDGESFYHDNIWGDFDGDGSDELIAWSQYKLQLLLFEIPDNPKNSGLWPATQIFSWTGSTLKYKGAEVADINLDGKIDFVGGGGWFEHTGGTSFTFHPIDDAMGYSQIKAGQLISGGRPEIVCVLELENGPLNMYTWTGSEWQKQTILATIPRSHSLQLGDINKDGHLDIMTGELGQWSPVSELPNNPNAKLSVLYGDGNGNFTQQVVLEGQGSFEGQLADMDNDGDLDIVTMPFRHNIPRLDIYLNELVDVPNIVGLSQADAEAAIVAAGLSAGVVTTDHSYTVSEGNVISQAPAAGTSVLKESAVDFVMSLGPLMVNVPDIVGLSQVDAEAAIIAAGLNTGAVTTQHSDTVPEGNVISQAPAAGTSVSNGSDVDLLVSMEGATYFQNFEVYVDNEDPDDWLDTGANNSLVEDNSLFKVFDLSGEKVFGTSSTATNIHSHYVGVGIDTLSAYEYAGRMMITNSGSSIGVTLFSNYPSTDAYYRLRRYGGKPSFQISSHGTSVSGNLDTGLVPASNIWYRFIIQVENKETQTEIRAKVWPEGGSEPSDWLANAYDNSPSRLTTGTIGLWSMGSGNKYWDDLAVYQLGSSPPNMLDVPNVVGLPQVAAEADIVAAGLSVGAVTTQNSNTVPEGNVISQAPAAGTSVSSGSAVALVVSSGTSLVNVPDTVGLSQVAAEADIVAAGLSVGAVTTQNSNTVPEGNVISQAPAAGTSVSSGSAVALVVSSGMSLMNVPDIVGLPQADAEAAIVAAGLSVGAITTEDSDTVPEGNVISQAPAAGTSVSSGSAVACVVSSGMSTINVPDIVGLPQADAEAAIVAAGLSVGSVTTEYSDTVPEGNVISQAPAAGTSVSSGSAVDILVSLEGAAYFEDFEAYADNEDPDDWLDTGANNSLVEDNSLFKVFDLSGEKVFGTSSTATNIHSHYVGADIDALLDYEYTGRMMVTNSGSGIGVTLFSNYPSTDAYYRLRRHGGTPSFQISSHGTNVSGDLNTGVVSEPNVWYRFIIQVEDSGAQTEIRAKVWPEGENEPSGWLANAYDNSPNRLTTGTIGLWSMGSGVKYWDNLAVYKLGTSPPNILNVPNVVGMPQANAEAAVVAAGLSVGAVTTDYSNTVSEGNVISQTPAAGTSASSGSAVALVVSLGISSYFEDFEVYADNEDPIDWLDTGANNSLVEDNSLFKVFDLSGEKVFGTSSTATNIHSHYIGTDIDAFSDYEYTGRMMVTNSGSGIGVTFFSNYPSADAYYRLRRHGGTPSFQISSHGTSVNGDLDTGVVSEPNTWYRFIIQVENSGTQTEIRAKIWPEGESEPSDWLANAYDNSPSRLTTGKIGLWSMGSGVKYWDNMTVYRLGSLPSDMLSVPNVVGIFQADAEAAISAAGLTVGTVTTANSDTIPAGNILSQSPVAGTLIPIGSAVNLVVSSGPSMVEVPNVVGISQADAEAVIVAAGHVVGTVTSANSNTTQEGDIISQNPVDGTPVPIGSTVDLVVSSGPVISTGNRITDGQLVLYGFQEGTGQTINDLSGVGTPLNLFATDESAFNWLPGGGVKINSPTLITSANPATKITNAIKASGEISIEAWISPANTIQYGPARIVTLSQDSGNRNVTLGQGLDSSQPADFYSVRLRTTTTDNNGNPSLSTPSGSLTTEMDHVVYTRDAFGMARIYVNGVEEASRAESGDFSNWDDSYALALGDEMSGNRYWLGKYYMVAIFDRALDQPEIQQNFEEGPYLVSPISDDFNSCTLNQSVWTFVNPFDAGSYDVFGGGSGEAVLELSVPAATEHNPWGADGVNEALRVMQPATDVDFEIEVKFLSVPSSDFHGEGIVIEQDEENWLRFDVFHSSGQLHAFAGSTIGGSTTTYFNEPVAIGSAVYLRVTRVADQWIFWYSDDGTSWIYLGQQSQMLTVNQMGVFAANPNVASAFTAEVDYFFNTATPVSPEDGDLITLTVNISGQGMVSKSPDLPSYNCGDSVLLTAVPNSGWEFIGWSGSVSGNNDSGTIIMDEDKAVTATFTTNNTIINVWYGLNQSFGLNGQSQKWVNIVGNVIDSGNGVSSLTYSLEGGEPVTLRLGVDGRRLVNYGDFNADIDIADLLPGPNTLVLTATDNIGNVTTETVTIDYQPDTVWPLPYSIDWNTLATDEEIQDVAQVVDGKWRLENGNVRTDEPGYDRLIAIGDMTWGDYEITVPFTIHSKPSVHLGVGLIMRWLGHTDDPVVSVNPKAGWLPLGAVFWYRGDDRFEILGNDLKLLASQSRSLLIGTTYWLKARAVTVPNVGSFYSVKIWEDGQPEPETWDLTGQQGEPSDFQIGSILLLAHYSDVSFGNVTITQP